MRALLMVALTSGLLNLAPCAGALDVFPDEEEFGTTSASILVRVPNGGPLLVTANTPLRVAMAHENGTRTPFTTTPAAFTVPTERPDTAWHGLVGTTRLVLERPDPTRSVEVEVTDGKGDGAHFTWEAAPKDTPFPAGATVGALLAVAWAYRAYRRP